MFTEGPVRDMYTFYWGTEGEGCPCMEGSNVENLASAKERKIERVAWGNTRQL